MLAHKTNSFILKLLIVYNFNLLNFVRDQCKRILNSSLFNNMYNPFSFIHWIVQTVNEKNVQSFSLYSAFLWFIICLFSLYLSAALVKLGTTFLLPLTQTFCNTIPVFIKLS